MLKLLLIEDSSDGKQTHQGQTLLESPEQVHPIKVEALWLRVKNGRLENDVKAMLERLCSKRGFDSTQLLR